MLKILKAYIANNSWIEAHAYLGGQFHSLALVAIRKAVKNEPDEKKIAKYLELQGNIEAAIGKKELALKSYKSAIKIADKYGSEELETLKKRVIDSVRRNLGDDKELGSNLDK